MERILYGAAAMAGDEDAARRYCGSYILVHDEADKLFRCDGEPPRGYHRIVGGTDADGFLRPEYWSLPRVPR